MTKFINMKFGKNKMLVEEEAVIVIYGGLGRESYYSNTIKEALQMVSNESPNNVCDKLQL